jgi:hypothetical protein
MARTAFENVSLTAQEPRPLHAPLHLESFQPDAGRAVKRTPAPLVKLARHLVGQPMPPGLLVTRPLPTTVTVSELLTMTVEAGAVAASTLVRATAAATKMVLRHFISRTPFRR